MNMDDIHTGRMEQKRWHELMDFLNDVDLTPEEFAQGWHWCGDFDGLLVGPGMGELASCKCAWSDPEIQERVEKLREAERKLLDATIVFLEKGNL